MSGIKMEQAREPAFIPGVRATRKIGYRLDQARLKGANKETVDERNPSA